ncbi:MAG: PspC domain-containing protein [Coriobacteriia bacterium]|nr:PspC domain-containing protein [Coriobacteriia bacterium]MCL2749479.1 PspC domain-containing protein [Coriobacteriia bacterium]
MVSDGSKKPNKNNKPPGGKVSFSTVALAVGILLVLFGIWQLAERFLGTWFHEIWQIISLVISIVWPLLIIAGGVCLMLLARKGNLNLPVDRKLYRSLRNKKIGGICGGIGEYLGADPAVVRVVTIVLAILCWYVILPLYLLFWIIIEPDNKNYTNYV